MKTLSLALSVSLAAFAFACGEPSSTNPEGEPPPALGANAPSAPKKKPAQSNTDTSESSTTGNGTDVPAADKPALPAGAPAKIRDGVRAYVASSDALWIATDNTVEKMAPDGAGPVPLGAFGATSLLALSDARVFGVVDKGTFYEIFSTKPDGTEGTHHLNWLKSNGEPTGIVINDGRIYFSAAVADTTQSKILSANATPPLSGNALYRTEELVDAKSVLPVFTDGHLFAVDHVRQSAVRVSLTDASESVDFIQDDVPMTAGGIALQGTDIYTRTAKGIVRAPTTAAANSTVNVVVPSTACPVFDEATGAASVLDDALVVDGTTLYAACRAGANAEVRAFAVADGKLLKTVATVPYGSGLSHLRVTSSAAYWLSRPTSTTTELWRAAK
jgi:hypothetical protein